MFIALRFPGTESELEAEAEAEAAVEVVDGTADVVEDISLGRGS